MKLAVCKEFFLNERYTYKSIWWILFNLTQVSNTEVNEYLSGIIISCDERFSSTLDKNSVDSKKKDYLQN